MRSTSSSVTSNQNPFDLVERDLVTRAVVQFRRPGTFVARDLLGFLHRASVLQVRRDAGGPKGMTANALRQPCGSNSSLDHPQGVVTGHRALGQGSATTGY